MADPRVLAVVLNWNGLEVTARCLDSLRRQTHSPREILVIDNGSTDGSVKRLPEILEPHELLALEQNVGYAGGMNVGISHALAGNYDYVWLLNNDAFPEPTCLEQLVAFLGSHPRAGVVTPLLVDGAGAPQRMGGRVNFDDLRVEFFDLDEIKEALPIDWGFTGAAPLVRLKCLRTLGRFDERMFTYFEDWDLWSRLRREGWEVHLVSHARCRHLEGSSSGGSSSPFVSYMMQRNKWLFVRKHLPRTQRPWAFFRIASEGIHDAGLASGLDKGAQASALVGAVWAMFRNEVGRPRRLSAPKRVERAALRHFWGIARCLDWLANCCPRPAKAAGRPESSVTANADRH